jgi:AcrR family transcriptional regulator
MARVLEFDVESSTKIAVKLFWSKGYQASTLDLLCHHMGISRSSFYGTLGDKRTFLLHALLLTLIRPLPTPIALILLKNFTSLPFKDSPFPDLPQHKQVAFWWITPLNWQMLMTDWWRFSSKLSPESFRPVSTYFGELDANASKLSVWPIFSMFLSKVS